MRRVKTTRQRREHDRFRETMGSLWPSFGNPTNPQRQAMCATLDHQRFKLLDHLAGYTRQAGKPKKDWQSRRDELAAWNRNHPTQAITTWSAALHADRWRFRDGKTLREAVCYTLRSTAWMYRRKHPSLIRMREPPRRYIVDLTPCVQAAEAIYRATPYIIAGMRHLLPYVLRLRELEGR